MQKRLTLLGLTILLAACSSTTATYSVVTNTELDARYRSALPVATSKMIERRLQAMGTEAKSINYGKKGDTETVTVKLNTAEEKEALTERLVDSFTFEIMLESTEEEADVVVADTQFFRKTELSMSDVYWVIAGDNGPRGGKAAILFTQNGAEKMRALLTENGGKHIGLFIRGILTAKLLVEPGGFEDHIVISQIPTAELADVFADDVNVGLHVDFALLK